MSVGCSRQPPEPRAASAPASPIAPIAAVADASTNTAPSCGPAGPPIGIGSVTAPKWLSIEACGSMRPVMAASRRPANAATRGATAVRGARRGLEGVPAFSRRPMTSATSRLPLRLGWGGAPGALRAMLETRPLRPRAPTRRTQSTSSLLATARRALAPAVLRKPTAWRCAGCNRRVVTICRGGPGGPSRSLPGEAPRP